ncbi:MAG: putative zinc-binding protein [Kiritimatiellae bacterium]|nr:putative zinc-binding protein [Kiritimatiellia bacterium]MDD5519540.1 putative zinc-binding protein [Kiritimatiellia bacterium]
MIGGKQKVVIVPCSGIGKPFGTVSREAAYEVCDNIKPDDTQLVALSKLVLGDNEARDIVTRNQTVTIDGCTKMCAATMVRQSGGTIAKEITVFDAFRRHKDLKPEGIAELNDQGIKLAQVMAREIADIVDEVTQPSKGKGDSNG